MADYHLGDKFQVIGDSDGNFSSGEIVYLNAIYGSNFSYANFSRQCNGDGKKGDLYWDTEVKFLESAITITINAKDFIEGGTAITKYKVGDRFRVAEENSYFDVGTLVYLNYDDGTQSPHFCSNPAHVLPEACGCDDGYYLLYETVTFIGDAYMSDNLSTEQQLKNLDLSDDDRLLQEAGVTDTNGDLTDAGKRIVTQYAFKAAKASIVKDLQAVKAAKESKPSAAPADTATSL